MTAAYAIPMRAVNSYDRRIAVPASMGIGKKRSYPSFVFRHSEASHGCWARGRPGGR